MGYICLTPSLAKAINRCLKAHESLHFTQWRLQAFGVTEPATAHYFLYLKTGPTEVMQYTFDYAGHLVKRAGPFMLSKLPRSADFWRAAGQLADADVAIVGYTEEDMVAQNNNTVAASTQLLAQYRAAAALANTPHLGNTLGNVAVAGGAWHLPIGFDPEAQDPWANVQGADPNEW